jgi:hypothetical protein
MSLNEGDCPYCGSVNSYSATHCLQCREELPWSQWVQAREQPSQAIGARPGSMRKGGEAVTDGFSALSVLAPSTVFKFLLILVMMTALYFGLQRVSSSLSQVNGGSTGNSTGVSGNAVEQFKKANPTVNQEAPAQGANTP